MMAISTKVMIIYKLIITKLIMMMMMMMTMMMTMMMMMMMMTIMQMNENKLKLIEISSNSVTNKLKPLWSLHFHIFKETLHLIQLNPQDVQELQGSFLSLDCKKIAHHLAKLWNQYLATFID